MTDNARYKTNSDKVTTRKFRKFKKEGKKISVLTAYDYPTAKILDSCGVDSILVGDSAATVIAGHENTIPITMDEMIFLTKSVSRGIKRALLVGDMPFMSFQISESEAIRNAGRFLKEGGATAVKLEGGTEIAPLVEKLVSFGIPVMGHIGLTPQSVNKLGGHLVMGRTKRQKKYMLQSAKDLQDAGCYSIVLESVVAELAREITESLSIPTIGIGAGKHCDGQVLVISDLIGLFEDFKPKFVRKYANVADTIRDAVSNYIDDINNGEFPSDDESYQ